MRKAQQSVHSRRISNAEFNLFANRSIQAEACRAPAAVRLHHGPAAFLPISVLWLLFSTPTQEAQSDPKHCLVAVEHKCPLNAGPVTLRPLQRRACNTSPCLRTADPCFSSISAAQLQFSAHTRMPYRLLMHHAAFHVAKNTNPSH